MDPVFLAFITGLTSGGISCMAVQGGLLASALSNQKEDVAKSIPVATFLGAKLISYTISGFLLGMAGSALAITPSLQGWMQIAAGLFMLVTVGRMLNLHPIFRYFVIQPPKSIYKLLKRETQDSSLITPAFLGFLTVLIPCGITQGMFVYAIASGNAVYGAAIMFAYTLGTSPVFFALGVSAAHLMRKKAFNYITTGVILVLGFMAINTGQTLRGSTHTFQNYKAAIFNPVPKEVNAGKVAGINAEGLQEVTINVVTGGYVSDVDAVKAGVPTRLKLVTNNTYGCSRAFTIPKLGYQITLPETGEEVYEFTPTEKGLLSYTCSMGMYTGKLNVI